jgi:hypothetical protein
METNSPENFTTFKSLNKYFELAVKQARNPFEFYNTDTYSAILTELGYLLIKIDKNNITCSIELQELGIKQQLSVPDYMKLSKIYLESYRACLTKKINKIERKIERKIKIKYFFEIFLKWFIKPNIQSEQPISTPFQLIDQKNSEIKVNIKEKQTFLENLSKSCFGGKMKEHLKYENDVVEKSIEFEKTHKFKN